MLYLPLLLQSLRKEGKGSLPQASAPFTDEDIDQFYKHNLLGNSNPMSLLRTLHRNNMSYFGLRANQEHRDSCFGDIVLGHDAESGLKFLEYKTERATKTRTGLNPRNKRQVYFLFLSFWFLNFIIRLFSHWS